LELETVLRRIVESAVTLVDARYGALGVVGEEGTIRQFITVGMDEETIARIGHYPTGHPGPADPGARAAASGRPGRASGVLRLPVRASADAVLPRRPGMDSRPGLRQPLPHRQAERGRVRRG